VSIVSHLVLHSFGVGSQGILASKLGVRVFISYVQIHHGLSHVLFSRIYICIFLCFTTACYLGPVIDLRSLDMSRLWP
jgi:hypothetical protein